MMHGSVDEEHIFFFTNFGNLHADKVLVMIIPFD